MFINRSSFVTKYDSIMVKYVVSFLVSFKKVHENDVEEEIGELDESENEEQNYYRFFKPHGERKNICNVTCIFPGPRTLMESKLTIACWSRLVKIYNKKEDVTLRTAFFGGKVWAAVTIEYELEDFDVGQLKYLFTRMMEFQFDDSQKFVLQRVSREKLGLYYCPKSQDQEKIFEPLCEVKDKSSNSSTMRTKSKVLTSTTAKKISSSPEKLIKTARFTKVTTEPELCQSVSKTHICQLIKAMASCSTEGISTSSHASGACHLSLPVSNLFTDKLNWVIRNEKPLSSNIEDVIVVFTAYSFLTEETRQFLNPFTVNIKSLQYLPIRELEKKGIKKLFVEYELEPVIPLTKTLSLDLKHDMLLINGLKIFLTDDFSHESIISCLQSKKLLVRVMGLKDVPSKAKETERRYGIYGSGSHDDRFPFCIKMKIQNDTLTKTEPYVPNPPNRGMSDGVTNKLLNKTTSSKVFTRKAAGSKNNSQNEGKPTTAILLGIAKIDISSIVFGNYCITAYERISSLPNVIFTQLNSGDGYFSRFTITEVHTNRSKVEEGALQNRSLFENNTMIKLIVKCGYLLKTHVLKSNPFLETYSRSIIIFKDKEFATAILKKVLLINSLGLDMNDYSLPLVPMRKIFKVERSPLLKPPDDESNLSTETNEVSLDDKSMDRWKAGFESWFTGFCIDSVNKVLMFIEGQTRGVFPSLLTELMNINLNQGRVMYSSDLLYTSRFYGAFKEIGGVYCITMNNNVDELIRKTANLCYGAAVPDIAMQALKMICKLYTCKNVLEGVLNDYLPLPEQLVSFDVEFGLPHCIENY